MPDDGELVAVHMTSLVFFFFFSSRRRHTRCSRDWSSDVCSSDLAVGRRGDVHGVVAEQRADAVDEAHVPNAECGVWNAESTRELLFRIPNSAFRTPDHSRQAWIGTTFPGFTRSSGSRSEERRVGK